MTGIYFSGTGNTKYCVEQYVKLYDDKAGVFPIESEVSAQAVADDDIVVIGFPVQYSNIPKILRDYVDEHKDIWNGKRVYIIATMAMFSGDGAGVLARLLERYGAEVTGGLHLKMPDSICDEKALKRTAEGNRKLLLAAERKTEAAVSSMKSGKPTQDGLKFFHRLTGFFGQRLYFGHKANKYSKALKINPQKCVGCGKCARLCPMGNIAMEGNRAVAGEQCTMCYRCISRCPKQAITLLGRKVIEQFNIDEYKKVQ